MKGTHEEAGHLGAACGVWTPWLPGAPVVAQEGSVTKHIPPAADMHGVSEVTQRRADHVHRELALEAAFLLRARRKALQSREFCQAHGNEKLPGFPLNQLILSSFL